MEGKIMQFAKGVTAAYRKPPGKNRVTDLIPYCMETVFGRRLARIEKKLPDVRAFQRASQQFRVGVRLGGEGQAVHDLGVCNCAVTQLGQGTR